MDKFYTTEQNDKDKSYEAFSWEAVHIYIYIYIYIICEY